MPTATAAIGTQFPAVTVSIERGRLQLFSRAIGQRDPIYTDVTAARAAGHPDLPVPPTFFFGLTLDGPDPFGWLIDLDIDLRHVLHGEQTFTYDDLAHAGDELTLATSITDAYSKKALDFIERRTTITHTSGRSIATMRELIVVRRVGEAP